MLIQDATENLVVMQQGNGGEAKKGSMSVAGKSRAVTSTGRVKGGGNRRVSTNRKLKTAMNQAQATKDSAKVWNNKTGTKGATKAPKLTPKTANAAAAAVRASNDMWG